MIRKMTSIPGKESHIVKIAVELGKSVIHFTLFIVLYIIYLLLGNPPEKEVVLPQLIEFNQQMPLVNIITDLCNNWNIQADSKDYSLKFHEINNKNYVTEKNRGDVKNGSVLKLAFSSAKTVSDMYDILTSTNAVEKTECLKQLSVLSSDETFALDFITMKGQELLIKMIEDRNCDEQVLQYVMMSFVEIMDHGTVSWDVLDHSFIKRNIHFISDPNISSKSIVQYALSILENIVQHSSNWALVDKDFHFDKLFSELLKDSQVIQQNTIALINAIFIRSDDDSRKKIADKFSSRQYRDVLNNDVIGNSMGTELQHQLYVLQTLTMGLLKQRMIKIQASDQDAQEKIKHLRRIAFDGEHFENHSDLLTRRQQNNQTATHFAKLGFKTNSNPLIDFADTPGKEFLLFSCIKYT